MATKCAKDTKDAGTFVSFCILRGPGSCTAELNCADTGGAYFAL